MQRFALGIEYDGTDFAGWQSQANARSVQAALEAAVAKVADSPIVIHGAGRTDAGVHASGQVAHFDADAARSDDQWLMGVNSNLPADVAVSWVRPVAADFDARRSALARRYVYLIRCGSARSAILRRISWWVRGSLDVSAMREAATHWIGEHDFSAFRAAGCQSNTPMRCIHEIDIRHDAQCVAIEVTANAFLYHMVRNLVGTLVDIGQGRQSAQWAADVLAGRARTLAGATAPACGLTLAQVRYPTSLQIPPPPGLLWPATDWK